MHPRSTWKKEQQLGRCGIALCSCYEDDMWYIYSGCSHHMLADRRKIHFVNKTKDVCVVFEGSETT